MWFFRSPEVAFGKDALRRLEALREERGFIVADMESVQSGFAARVKSRLTVAGLTSELFAEVDGEPLLATAHQAAAAMTASSPDWIIGLGASASLQVARAAWLLYARPDLDLLTVKSFERFGLRRRARFIAIPTTSGSGPETSWLLRLSTGNGWLELEAEELLPDLVIIDPALRHELSSTEMADGGLDALTDAVEAYASVWANDFSDGLCLQAARLIFNYLPRAYSDRRDEQAQERLYNAAILAGLAASNASLGLAHALGGALACRFGLAHGRAAGLVLPYTIEYTVRGGGTRYADFAQLLARDPFDERDGARQLIAAIRELLHCLDCPASVAELSFEKATYQAAIPELVDLAEADSSLVTSHRIPDREALAKLFACAYDGRPVDF